MDETTVETTSSSKVILSVIVILVIAAIGFAMLKSSKNNSGTATTTNATSSEETAFSGNLLTLVARGGDWKCVWSSEKDGVKLDGTVFIGRGKFKSDVESSGSGLSATGHAIGDGQFVYAWSSSATTGVKFPMTQSNSALEVSGSNVQDLQFSESYTYDCQPWTAESGAFALPSGVTFLEAAQVN